MDGAAAWKTAKQGEEAAMMESKRTRLRGATREAQGGTRDATSSSGLRPGCCRIMADMVRASFRRQHGVYKARGGLLFLIRWRKIAFLACPLRQLLTKVKPWKFAARSVRCAQLQGSPGAWNDDGPSGPGHPSVRRVPGSRERPGALGRAVVSPSKKSPLRVLGRGWHSQGWLLEKASSRSTPPPEKNEPLTSQQQRPQGRPVRDPWWPPMDGAPLTSRDRPRGASSRPWRRAARRRWTRRRGRR